ncbi:MAG: hypothetical protein ABI723_01275 [Bacteroidia bacterium]
MPNKYSEQMSKQTDAELIKIVNELRDDYETEAVSAAEEELAKRNLSSDQISTAKEEIEKKKQFDERRANEPLGPGWKILTAMFPGLIQIFFSATFKTDGYDRKARELVTWTLYGFGFYFGFIILIILLGKIF